MRWYIITGEDSFETVKVATNYLIADNIYLTNLHIEFLFGNDNYS